MIREMPLEYRFRDRNVFEAFYVLTGSKCRDPVYK
jgi:hypothetical protein